MSEKKIRDKNLMNWAVSCGAGLCVCMCVCVCVCVCEQHKVDFKDKRSVDPEKYTFSLIGRKPISLEDKRKLGQGYIQLLQTSIPEKMETLTSHFRVRVGGLKVNFGLHGLVTMLQLVETLLELYVSSPKLLLFLLIRTNCLFLFHVFFGAHFSSWLASTCVIIIGWWLFVG